jgi:ribosomal protein S26
VKTKGGERINTKNCPNCSRELPEESAFCLFCMEKLVPEEAVLTAGRPAVVYGGKRLIAVLYALLAVVSVCCVLLALLYFSPEPPEPSLPEPDEIPAQTEYNVDFLNTGNVWTRSVPEQQTTANGGRNGTPLTINSPVGPLQSVFLDMRDSPVTLKLYDLIDICLFYDIALLPESVNYVVVWFVSGADSQYSYNNFPVFTGATILDVAYPVGGNDFSMHALPLRGRINLSALRYHANETLAHIPLSQDYELLGVVVQIAGTGSVTVNELRLSAS